MIVRAVLTSIALLLVLRGSVAGDVEETLPPTGETDTTPPATKVTTAKRTEIITEDSVKCAAAGYYYDPADNKCKTCGKNTYNPPDSDVCIPCPEGTYSPTASKSEDDCEAAEACPEGKIRCADGENCVDKWKLCDGKNDCRDGSDETDTLCRSGTCPEGTTTCADNVTCVSTRGWCDGRPVCPENEDEEYEMCKGYQCAKQDWKCGEGTRCITRWVICDGKVDCTDGSDEAEEMCRNYECPSRKARCLDGLQCVSKKRLCDGKFQCHDGSDEFIRNDETCPGGYDEFDVDSKPSIREIIEIWKSKCKPPRVWRRRKCRRAGRRKPGEPGEKTDEPIDPTVTPLPGTTDAPCPDGSFRTADGGCQQCEENTYLQLGDRHCTPCPEGKVSAAGSRSITDCTWEPCTAGNYMTVEGCKVCPANTFSGDGAKKCRNCPEGLVSDPGSTSRKDCGLPELPTCDCNIPECDYCTKMECTVQQDLFTSETGVVVTSQVKWSHHNTIVFYDEDGQIISKLEWSRQYITLTGCATCKTPQALKDATSKEEPTTWGFSLKDGLLKVTVDGEVLYERQLPEECANIYLNIKRFAFSDMTCENTFTYQPHEMVLGERITPDCGGHCPTEE